jgi:tripartite-type tricarboxylate transporter receptor subunit TctC
VFINIDAYGQAKPASGLLQNCGPILASKKDLVAAYLDHFHVCTINGSADELFSKDASTRIGTNKPGGFWQPVVDKINKENKSSHKRIQYGGSGDTRKALLSGEVDYVFLSTRHTYKLENAGATCFAEFTDSKKLKYEHTVNDLSAGKDKFDSSFATGWSLFNADKKMVKKLRVQIRSLFENDSNIIKALGGSTPINYYGWDKSISARVKWVNGSIDRWAQAMKQAAQ